MARRSKAAEISPDVEAAVQETEQQAAGAAPADPPAAPAPPEPPAQGGGSPDDDPLASYVASGDDEPEDEGEEFLDYRVRVAAEGGLRLRVGPGKAFHVVRVLPYGTEASVLFWDRRPMVPAWTPIATDDGLVGWVADDYLEDAFLDETSLVDAPGPDSF